MSDLLRTVTLNIVTAAAFILPVLFTIQYTRRYCIQFSKISLFICLTGPLTTIAYMCGHLFDVVVVSATGIFNKTQVFDFHTYGLLLMGVVFLSLGIFIMKQIKGYCNGETYRAKYFYSANVYLCLLCAPVLLFNEDSLLIIGSSMFSCTAFYFITQAKKKRIPEARAEAYLIADAM